MAKEEGIIMEWIVKKVAWWWNYIIELDSWLKVYAKPKWKLIKMKIKILPGDRVKVQLNEIDPIKGYIIYRL